MLIEEDEEEAGQELGSIHANSMPIPVVAVIVASQVTDDPKDVLALSASKKTIAVRSHSKKDTGVYMKPFRSPVLR